ncbi:TrmH family RNA methyltransferase [Massilibacterium senegalense]|uniref:TrmH family RNA methyltransferase n=1 Tax=Massilibacterium senegalense TaxID=1632858 RepID=UPI000780D926|nr:RNA methyltransferase [Massilibacterium senegalense]
MKRIESVQNVRVKQLKKLHTKKGREKEHLFLIEGMHLIEEAMKHRRLILEIWIEEGRGIQLPTVEETIQIIEVTSGVMKTISTLDHPQGIVAVCQIQHDEVVFEKGKKYLLVDQVQDPGNIGTIIRTADASGIDAVILNNGTVDIYNDKVIRATQGSLFHLPVVYAPLENVISSLTAVGISVYGTSLLNGIDYREVKRQESFALLVGNEGSGVQESLLNVTTKNLYIPIIGKAESLNVAVATGILLYSLQE